MKNLRKSVASCVLGRKAGRAFPALLAVLYVSLSAASAAAASGNEISLTSGGSDADIGLYFPGEAESGVSSMQISVSISATDGTSAEFIPDNSLPAKIVESRYQSGTGTLNIYIAGTEGIFSPDGSAALGRITVSGNDGDASVEVVRDSVRFVRNGELVSPDSDTVYPAAVTVAAGGQTSPDKPGQTFPDDPAHPSPDQPEQPMPDVPGQILPSVPAVPGYPGIAYPEYPAGNVYPEISKPGTGSSISPALPENTDSPASDWSEYDSDTPYAEPEVAQGADGEAVPAPPDISPLLEAMAKADSVNEDDYTSDSYADLSNAVESARDTVYDPYATQSDIDDARLDIENAMGMLTPGNDIPSSAAGYSEKTENAAGVSSPDSQEQGAQLDSMEKVLPDVIGSVRADDSAGEDHVQTAAAPEKQESSTHIVLCIVLIAAVFACAAIIGIKRIKGSKTFGSHYKK